MRNDIFSARRAQGNRDKGALAGFSRQITFALQLAVGGLYRYARKLQINGQQARGGQTIARRQAAFADRLTQRVTEAIATGSAALR